MQDLGARQALQTSARRVETLSGSVPVFRCTAPDVGQLNIAPSVLHPLQGQGIAINRHSHNLQQLLTLSKA